MDADGDRLNRGKRVPARRPQLVVTQDAEALADTAARRLLDEMQGEGIDPGVLAASAPIGSSATIASCHPRIR